MLAPLDGALGVVLAALALQLQHNLLGGFCLLVENGLGLTTISRLLPVITTLSLGRQAVLTLLVLSDLVKGVLLALLVFAVGLLGLRNVHHGGRGGGAVLALGRLASSSASAAAEGCGRLAAEALASFL